MKTSLPLPRSPHLSFICVLYAVMAAAGLLLAVLGVGPFTDEVVPAADVAARSMGGFFALSLGLAAAYALTFEVTVDVHPDRVVLVTRRLGLGKTRSLPLDGRGVLHMEPTRIPNSMQTTMEVWPITYVHPEGSLQLHRPEDPQEARAWCERLARVLDVPMAAVEGAELEIRAPDEVDRPVVERTDWSELSWPELPADGRVTAEVGADGVLRVHLAPRGFGAPALWPAGFALLGGWCCWRVVEGIRDGLNVWGWLSVPIFGLVALGFTALGLYGLRHELVGTEEFEVDTSGVRQAGTSMSAERIESVTVGSDGESVLLRGDEEQMTLGSGLTEEQTRALRDMVLLALGGRRATERR